MIEQYVAPEGSEFVEIKAIIKPFRAEDVKEVLSSFGINGLTATEVKWFWRQKGHTEKYRGSEYTVDYIPKLELALVIERVRANDAVKKIIEAANDGKIGAGIITVSDVANVIRIRTWEHGKDVFAQFPG